MGSVWRARIEDETLAFVANILRQNFRSIQARVSAAVLVAALLMVVGGGLLFATTHRLGSLPQLIHDDRYTVSVALGDMRGEFISMHASLDHLPEAPTNLLVRKFLTEAEGVDRRIEEGLGAIGGRTVLDPASIDRLASLIHAWRLLRLDIADAGRAGDDSTASTLLQVDGVGLVSDITVLLDEMVHEATALSQTSLIHNDRLRGIALVEVLIGLMIGLCGLIVLSFFLRRSIIEPTIEISSAIRAIAQGELDSSIPHCGRTDEIGQIARSAKVFLEYALAIRDSQFDFTTGLPSRSQLHDHLRMVRLDPEARLLPAALVHFDIDRFGEINDSYGRQAGDAYLEHAARVLRQSSRIGDFVARDGADSFSMLILGMDDKEDVARFAREICIGIGRGVEYNGETVQSSCSVGVAICEGSTPVETLLGRAESALHEARKIGPGAVEIYTEELDARLRHRRETLVGLKFALAHDEIVPFFQPQIDAVTGEVFGFEALVRWNHPEQGVLLPWQFIGIASDAGLLTDLADTMISKTVNQLAAWRKAGLHIPRVSVNLGAAELGRDGFVDLLMLEVDRAGLAPKDICVELLESAMIEGDDNPVSKALDRLGGLGFPIELDDFGTGHAAISTLHLVKLSGIKIDRSFVTKMDQHVEQQHLTRGILRISRALQICTVAEGVESEAERELLVRLGCDVIQGFWISPPMSSAMATDWLETYIPVTCNVPLAEIA